MPPPVSGISEAFPTAATPVSVVVSVKGDDVPLHGGLVLEPGRTEGAAVWPLSRVRSEVVNDVLPCTKTGRAHLTLELLHSIVGLHM